jgi:heat shock protein HslJ
MKVKTTIVLSLILLTAALTGAAWADALAGTAWNVTGYYDGKGAVTGLIADTEITARFTGDGTLYGSSGCNDYTTSYSVERNRIAVSSPAVTRKFSIRPAGVMEQESAFLDALESAVIWQIRGDTLELFAKDGYPAVTMKSATHDDDELYITIDGETFRMKRVISASGAKYEAVDDPTTVYWSKGRDAYLTVRGKEYSKYVLIRNSPNDDEIFLTIDGENFSLHRVRAASGAKYEAENDPSTFFWSKGDTAALYVRGREYAGYDASSEAAAPGNVSGVPIGLDWIVTSIAGEPTAAGSIVTIRFDHNARVSGSASVNTYISHWIATGSRLLIEDAASTQMAGPQDLMEQEHRFLKALVDVRGFEVRGDTLILITKDGKEITAQQQQ